MSQKCHSILRDSAGRKIADVAAVSADLESGFEIPEHSHPEDQLLFASRGVMRVRTHHGLWVVPPLRAVWIPAGTLHSVAMCGAVCMRTLYFSPNLCRGIHRRGVRGQCFVFNISALLRELILYTCRFPRLKKTSAPWRAAELLIHQLEHVSDVPLQLAHPTDPRAMRIAAILASNPSDARTLAALCRDCGASKRTVQRLFVEQTGLTFSRWRRQLRLFRALERLASGESVTGSALDAGYNSVSAFISMFRKQLGQTPRGYLGLAATSTDP